MEDKEEKRVWVLDKEHEFRMEVGFDRTVTVTLVDGMAEVFGSEMAQTKAYSFCGKKVGIFTWSGCRLEVRGTPGITYVSDSTPMLAYINTHMALEQRRAAAEKNKTPGPRITATAPLIYHYGHTSPSENPALFKVVARDSAFRQRERNQRIKEYFYGPGGSLCPHSTLVKFDSVKLFKIGAPPVPLSCLPLGVDPAFNETKLTPLPFSDDLVHALVSVSNAEEPTQAVVDTSVVGFVYVSHMDMANKQMTILSPAPGPLPRRILLSGTLRWIEQ